jgi:hypothetical protein
VRFRIHGRKRRFVNSCGALICIPANARIIVTGTNLSFRDIRAKAMDARVPLGIQFTREIQCAQRPNHGANATGFTLICRRWKASLQPLPGRFRALARPQGQSVKPDGSWNHREAAIRCVRFMRIERSLRGTPCSPSLHNGLERAEVIHMEALRGELHPLLPVLNVAMARAGVCRANMVAREKG